MVEPRGVIDAMRGGMIRRLLPLLVVTACDPVNFDFNLDLDPGPIVGDKGVATFSFVDGCPGSDFLFGCPKHLPTFATGSVARFVVGSISGEPDAENQIATAKVVSSDSKIVVATRDTDGFLHVLPVAAGDATIDLLDDATVIDSIAIHVEPISSMTVPGTETPTILAGARFAAVVNASSSQGEPLYAHGAITPSTSGGLVVEHTSDGYFTASEQFAVRGAQAGMGRVYFHAGDASTEGHFNIVTRDQLTELVIDEVFPEAGANKVRLEATGKVGTTPVEGGPACEWSIVSGGGPGAAMATGVDDDLNNGWFTLYTNAIVYGEGDMTVECRATDRLVAQHTLHLGP